MVCQTEGLGNNAPSPFLCSQSSAANVLIASMGQSITITVAGSPLKLLVDGSSGSLTITNNSNDVLATNIVADLTGPLANAGVTVTRNTCTSLAPQMSCTLTFLLHLMVIYISNFGDSSAPIPIPGSVSKCSQDPNTGSLTNCVSTGSNFNGPAGDIGFLTLNS